MIVIDIIGVLIKIKCKIKYKLTDTN